MNHIETDLREGDPPRPPRRVWTRILPMFFAFSLAARAEPAYTNHAGYAVSGVLLALDATTVTVSNETESVTVPLSIFPEPERRRLAADYVLSHPGAGTALLRVPDDVRKAVDANDKAMRRSRLRASKGLCTQEESDAFCAEARAALDAWLDGKARAGEILPFERRALSPRPVAVRPAAPGAAPARPRRKVIIDTDAGSDDAAAMMLAAVDDGLDILGVTVLYGNVTLPNAASNALTVLEVCGRDVPVYLGASRPLVRERRPTIGVHGADGLGDRGLVHPSRAAAGEDAVGFILDSVRAHPGEVEIIALGPLTNLALAVGRDPEAMRRVRRVWAMGTAGFGAGNASPVAEFNVYLDAEAYDAVLRAGLPMTIVGLDCMTDGTRVGARDMEALARGNARGRFMHEAFSKLFEFYRGMGQDMGVPDALAVAAAIWPECVLEATPCHGVACVGDGPAYGQVILYRQGVAYEAMPEIGSYNLDVVSGFDAERYKRLFMASMTAD